MGDSSEQGKQEVQAFIHRISPSIVYFHTVAPAELTLETDGRSSVGTGFLVQYRGHKYFISALHNFFYQQCGLNGVVSSWEAAKFKFGGSQTINFEETRTFPRGQLTIDVGVSIPHSFPDGLLIDEENDLMAVEVDDNHECFGAAQFLDLERDGYSGTLQHEMSLVTLGNPFAGRVPIPENHTVSALIPHLDHVLFDVNQKTPLTNLPSADYFFMPYSLDQDQVPPQGFSGAPVFAQGGSDAEPVWSATPRVVGMMLRYFDKQHVIAAVKIVIVIRLLEQTTIE